MKKILLLTLLISLLPIHSNAQDKEIIASGGFVACFGKQMLINFLKDPDGYLPDDCFELNPRAEVIVIQEDGNYIQIKPKIFEDVALDDIVELWTTKEAIKDICKQKLKEHCYEILFK